MTSIINGSPKGASREEIRRIRTLKAPTEPHVKDAPFDVLPIVELKPFVRKVWRREKSLPTFYDNYDAFRFLNGKSKEQNKRPSSFPQSPLPEKTELYIDETQKEKKKNPDSPRPRAKMHPPAETKAPKQVEHSQSFVPGLLSRTERSKSTLYEIHCEDAPSKLQTGLKQSLDRKDVDEPPVINLTGENLTSSRRSGSFIYLSPFRNHLCHKGNAWPESNESGLNQFLANQLQKQKDETTDRINTPFYDTFDRNGTLPSIQVYRKNLRKDLSKSRGGYEEIHPRELLGLRSPIHKIGGITNSLHMLSKVGAPTMIEKELTRQLEIDLRKFRRSRNYYFPFDMTPYELAKYYPPPSASMTRGELQLRKGLESNMSRRKSRGRQKSIRSAPEKMETKDFGARDKKDSDDVFDDEDVVDDDDDEDVEIHKLTGFQSDTVEMEGRISNVYQLVDSRISINIGDPDKLTQTDIENALDRAMDSRTDVTHKANLVKVPNAITPLPVGKDADDEITSTGSSEVIQSVRDANSTDQGEIDTDVESTRTFITASIHTKHVSEKGVNTDS